MATLIQVTFPFNGPFGQAMTDAMQGLAQSISQEPGLIWKLWTENAAQHEAGGIYLFDTQENAKNYANMHCERLSASGVQDIEVKYFSVNQPLSEITLASFLKQSEP